MSEEQIVKIRAFMVSMNVLEAQLMLNPNGGNKYNSLYAYVNVTDDKYICCEATLYFHGALGTDYHYRYDPK